MRALDARLVRQYGWSGTDTPERVAALTKPSDVIRIAPGRIAIADAGSGRVIACDWPGPRPSSVTTLVSGLRRPAGLAVRGRTLAIADAGARSVLIRRPDGTVVSVAFTDRPFGCDFTPDGDIAVAHTKGVDVIQKTSLRVSKHLRAVHGVVSPRSVDVAEDGRMLIADYLGHRVLEYQGANLMWSHGVVGEPGRSLDRLIHPWTARWLPNGDVLVTDSGNHRLLRLDREPRGTSRAECVFGNAGDPGGGHDRLWLPQGLRVEHEIAIIANTFNDTVMTVDIRNGAGAVAIGRERASASELDQPRSTDLSPDGRTLVIADGRGNKVISIDRSSGRLVQRLTTARGAPLSWPRSASFTRGTSGWIADGLGNRCVQFTSSPRGTLIPTGQRTHGDGLNLRDPHSIRERADGRVVICDTGNDRVVIAEGRSGPDVSVRAALGIPFSDPHSAEPIGGGRRLLVADTGNDRVALVDTGDGDDVEVLPGTLRRPRFATVRGGVVMIVDTDANLIRLVDQRGDTAVDLTDIVERPRHAKWSRNGSIIVADTLNSRVLEFALTPAPNRRVR